MLIQGLCPTLIGPTSAVSRFAVGHFGKNLRKDIAQTDQVVAGVNLVGESVPEQE